MKAYGYKKGEQFVIDLWPIGGGFYLEERAAQDFLRMEQAADADGIVLRVNTAYRNWRHQKRLHNDYLKAMAAWDAGGRLGKKPPPVAQPGFSNHQSGIALDINRAPGDDPATPQPDSPVDLWLAANAARFGFVRTVSVEAWHWEHRPDLAAKKVA